MGQVPRAKPWLLLGDGRLALHLTTYLRHLGIDCRRWSRAHGWHQPSRTGGVSLQPRDLSAFDRVLVAIADDALPGVVERYSTGDDPPWIHFSGSRRIEGAWGAHPLCAFGPELYEPETYRSISFVVEREGPGLGALLPGLPNPSIAIPAADKPLYHALCVMAGNFTTLLWQRFLAEAEGRWNLDSNSAAPYLRQVLANLESAEHRSALTGPIARGDRGTIECNLAALSAAGLDDLGRIYAAFLESFRPVGEESAA